MEDYFNMEEYIVERYLVTINRYGTIIWYNEDEELHRAGGLPAIEGKDGTKQFYINGKRHNPNGPARIYADGTKEYWIDGKQISEDEFNEKKYLINLTVPELADKLDIPLDELIKKLE